MAKACLLLWGFVVGGGDAFTRATCNGFVSCGSGVGISTRLGGQRKAWQHAPSYGVRVCHSTPQQRQQQQQQQQPQGASVACWATAETKTETESKAKETRELTRTTKRRRSLDMAQLEKLSACQSGTSARRLLERVVVSNKSEDSPPPLYNSLAIPLGASARPVSDADLAISTKIRNGKYSVMELIELNGDSDADRASLAIICLTVASMLSSVVANQTLLPGPEIVRWIVVWLLSFAPLAFVGYGIATPSELQSVLVEVQARFFPSFRTRMVQHEAGHFLLGYLLGWPIQGYSTGNAVKNAVEFYPLSDTDVGRERARQLGFDLVEGEEEEEVRSWNMERDDNDDDDNTSRGYFSEKGGGGDLLKTQSVFRKKSNQESPMLQLPSRDNPRSSWPFRGFDEETLDRLAVISVGGVAAELLAFGNAKGGYADFSQLRQILASSEEQVEDDLDNRRVRFALGFAVSQLRQHVGALDALAEIMARNGSLAECIQAVEECPQVQGTEQEEERRARFQNAGLLERMLLGGGGKNANVQDTSVVEGKGGGDRRDGFAMSGNDPFYAAAATALVFLIWALNGGLSLH